MYLYLKYKIQINIIEYAREWAKFWLYSKKWSQKIPFFHIYFDLVGKKENKEAHKTNDHEKVALKQTNEMLKSRITPWQYWARF